MREASRLYPVSVRVETRSQHQFAGQRAIPCIDWHGVLLRLEIHALVDVSET